MQPKAYISGFAGKYCIVVDSMPITAQILTWRQALEFAKDNDIQTDLVWDGDKGEFTQRSTNGETP